MTIDTASLEPAEAAALESAVRDARFTELPPQVGGAPAGAADHRTYRITVDDGQHANSVSIIEPVTDPTLQRLVICVEQLRRRARGS